VPRIYGHPGPLFSVRNFAALLARVGAHVVVNGRDARRTQEAAARVRAELEGLGVAVEADEAGNLLARIAGPADAAVLLCAHLDTVTLEAPVEPVREDGVIRNRNQAILGADNKAAIATILGAVRRAEQRLDQNRIDAFVQR